MTDLSERLLILQALEIELHQPAIRHDAQRVDALLHQDFTETGRSGIRYTGLPEAVHQTLHLTFSEIQLRSNIMAMQALFNNGLDQRQAVKLFIGHGYQHQKSSPRKVENAPYLGDIIN